MRFLRVLGLFVLLLCVCASASSNTFGVRDVSHVKFDVPTQVGSVVMPAGEYTIRHSMEGQDHIMAFSRGGSKEVFKVKCTLVQLDKRADQDQRIYEMSGNQKVLRQLIFRGDTAKHVF